MVKSVRQHILTIFEFRILYNRGRDSWIKFCNLEKNSAQFLNALIQKEIEDSAPALIPVDDYLEENCHAEIEYSHDRSRTISCRSTVMGSITPVQVDSFKPRPTKTGSVDPWFSWKYASASI